MLRLCRQVHVDSLDLRPFVATLPAFLIRWRQLRFHERRGLHPATEQRWAGLQVVRGSHPYPGTVYRLVFERETVPESTAAEPFEG
jgi:hypothetical protein